MRDYVNPLLLLVIVVLLACRAGGVGEGGLLDGWVLALCVTAFVVNGALCVARLLAHRRALMSTVWSTVYLILGSCAWVLHGAADLTNEEQAAYAALEQACRQGGSPYEVDADGDSFFTLAASLGKSRVVRNLLAAGAVPPEQLAVAARRAAENGRTDVLQQLLAAGVAVNAPTGGTTLLCAAAQEGRVGTVALLLGAGADANLADSDGTPPLIHAVLADSLPVVESLLKAGANAAATDAEGRKAADFSRGAQMDKLLTPNPSL